MGTLTKTPELAFKELVNIASQLKLETIDKNRVPPISAIESEVIEVPGARLFMVEIPKMGITGIIKIFRQPAF